MTSFFFRRNLILACYLTIQIACGQVKTETSATQNEETAPIISTATEKLKLNPGTLVQRINCSENGEYNFALYIPSGFTEGKNWPVIFLFDPHGDGTFPLNKYRKLADKYGYFLAGSNNSKNGNKKEQTAAILQSFITSAYTLLPVDSQRLYAAGFSGGGRVASMLAFSPAGFEGLITCGAGFPAESWTGFPPSVVIGIAGNGDMNLNELNQLNFTNPAFQERFQLIRFNGKHEWPPEEVFEQGLIAFEAEAIRNGRIAKDKQRIKNLEETILNFSENKELDKDPILKAGLYERWIKNMNQIGDVSSAKETYRELMKNSAYQIAIKEDKTLFSEENVRKQFFFNALGKNDTIWWSNQMKNLQNEISNASDAKKYMLSRVTGNLSLVCFMNLNQSMATNNSDAVNYLSTLYRQIDPQNPEAWYLSCIVAAKNNQADACNHYLKEAIQQGFKERERLQAEPALQSMFNNPDFNQLIQRIAK